MRWLEEPNFNFIKIYKWSFAFSGFLMVAALIGIFARPLPYGIDFSGGKELILEFQQPVQVTQIRNALTEPLGNEPVVKRFGSPRDMMVRTQNSKEITEVQSIITGSLSKKYPQNHVSVLKTNIVGPRFAEDLKDAALNSVIFSLIVIFIYILIRFKDWRFSTGAVVALFHDVLIVLGVFAIFHDVAPFNMQIDEAIVAAFLTIVGYSLNDTVVVYDRIRENNLLYKTMDYAEMVNKSLNDTLSRTIMTSLTTLFVVTVLFFFGGSVLKGFSFALMLGIIIGTYSSIFVASSLVVKLEERKNNA